LEKKTFYIETYGCTSNKADSYIISDILKKANYTKTNLENAEYVIINTCAVKQQTENRIKSRLKDLYEIYHSDSMKRIIIAGCLPHIEPGYIEIIQKIVPNFSAIIDLDNLDELPDIFKEIEDGKKNLVMKSKKSVDKAEYLVDHQHGKITGILPISEGCLGSCTYCCVKNARGKLKCYNPEAIIRNAEHQLKQGIKQVYLTSQDCSIYQYNNTRLLELVQKLVNLDYKYFLRIGMLNPHFLIEHLDQLISIYQLDKVYQFLHVPIQSGSDKVLNKMNRTYITSEVKDNLGILKRKFPHITISTDIICGFPGETDIDFQKTIELIKWLKPEILNISKYTPRPGTQAEKMKQLDGRVIKERSISISNIFRQYLKNINKAWINWEGEIIVLHKGEREKQAFGRNYAYKNVFIDDYSGNYGEFLNVKIERVEGFNLIGKKC